MGILSLDKWFGVDGISYVESENTVFVQTPQCLIQAIGYAKYKLKDRIVYFRGQNEKYKTIEPALYREKDKEKNTKIILGIKKDKRSQTLNNLIEKLESKNFFMNGTPKNVYEAILQHYGFKTRYIDFVDNIWVALWFSTIDIRKSTFDSINYRISRSQNNFSYIYVISPGAKINQQESVGMSIDGTFITNEGYEIVDLRSSMQSIYLRPHAQHGVVIKKKTGKVFAHSDMMRVVKLVVKIPTQKAIKWLGDGDLISASNLFPSPYYDHGYAALMENNIEEIYSEMLLERGDKTIHPQYMIDLFGCIANYTY